MSKYLNYTIILFLLAGGCKNNSTKDNTSQTTDTTKIDTASVIRPKPSRQWIIKDSSMYSKQFLKELHDFKQDGHDSISLIDNYIVDGNDTVYFPDYFAGNKQYLLVGVKDSVDYKLQVFNCTYTKIQFIFTGTKNNKLVGHYYGEAEIATDFFMSKVVDTDNSDAVTYGISEYNGENEKYLYKLSIGAKGNKLLGRFYAHAKDSIANQSFTICPTLRYGDKYTPAHKHH